MYCICGASRSSLLIETTDSMITNKTFLEKMKCNVRLMIDRDVAEKKNENKVGMLSY